MVKPYIFFKARLSGFYPEFNPQRVSHKKRLIKFLQKNTDSNSDTEDPGGIKNRFHIFPISKLTVIELVMLAILSTSPVGVNAGVFSFISSVFSNPENITAQVIDSTQNSQNIALLRAAVNPNPNSAKGGGDITIIGDVALLSEVGPTGSMADIEDYKPASDQISIYVVREGDTLSQIATMFGVSINTIMWANGTERASLITPGETLVILPVSGIRHSVKSGETLRSIVKKYKGDIQEVLDYNSLTLDSTLAVGDIVTIPDGEIAAPKVPTTRSVARGTGGPTYSGYYLRPIVGGTKTQGIHGYNAVDIASSYGTPILASASGTVIINRDWGWNGGYGNYVVIRHSNGTQTLYAHNSRNIVSVGQRVVQGQVIGYIGSTGKSTGNHVHFEIRGARNPF